MRVMTWDAITKNYPNEWVALVDAEESTSGIDHGTVVAHSPERQRFHHLTQALFEKYADISIAYTGQLVKSTDLPFLWQISHT